MIERGEPNRYEIVWRTGHVETVLAHQVTWPNTALFLNGGKTASPNRLHFHAEVDGKWTLTLACDEEEILSIRLVSEPESIPDGAS